MKNIKYLIFSTIILLSSCSPFKDVSRFKGSYKGNNIIIQFTNSEKGFVLINKIDSIPFKYKIEKIKIDIKSNTLSDGNKTKFRIYRFTIDADYKTEFFPIGLYEIKNDKGKILHLNDSTILKKME